MTRTLRFGISRLDELFSTQESEGGTAQPITGCIIGPDGSGKSLLALHIVSTYWGDNHLIRGVSCPEMRLLYVSTDLSHSQAIQAWQNFGLNYPHERERVLKDHYDSISESTPRADPANKLQLIPISPNVIDPTKTKSIAKLFDSQTNTVNFLDLHCDTAGDDWTYLSHLVGLLPESDVPHLIVVDAVEGLEAFVGEHDGFGERRTRRSRIAQLIRCCTKANAHLFFVVEETRTDIRLAEQFVADVVIRLHHEVVDGCAIRTLEIEKCRSVSHVNGRHEFYIRSGRGTSTGEVNNLDHPEIRWTPDSRTLAHFYVIPSIQRWNTVVQQERTPVPTSVGSPTFGLEEIDGRFSTRKTLPLSESAFVHGGSLTVLLGDAGTHKKSLARAFLAKAIGTFDVGGDPVSGVAVLISCNMVDQTSLSMRLCDHLPPNVTVEELRVLCRRLSVRHLSSSQFISILQCYIRKAQMLAFGDIAPQLFLDPRTADEAAAQQRGRAYRSSPIRVVISDWSLLMAMHPNMAQDPLLLPSVAMVLNRDGVTGLILSTEAGEPIVSASSQLEQDLRKLDVHKVFTWTVPFFGERRTAVATSESTNRGGGPEIYELRFRCGTDTDAIEINRHFALYSGLQSGSPERVPLTVRLYGGPHCSPDSGDNSASGGSYPQALKQTLEGLFVAAKGQDVVTFLPFAKYDDFFAFADWLDDTRLPNTLVMQVDEYWSDKKSSLCSLRQYARSEKVSHLSDQSGEFIAARTNDDVFKVFQPHPPSDTATAALSRHVPTISKTYQMKWKAGEPIDLVRRDLFALDSWPDARTDDLDRIPYLWDFGVILARKDLWERCKTDSFQSESERTVAQVWDSLCLERDIISKKPTGSIEVTWADFFEACRIVGRRSGLPAFDVDFHTAESLSSFVLEVWGSIAEKATGSSDFERLHSRTVQNRTSLKSLLKTDRQSLFCAFEQIVSACSHFVSDGGQVRGHKDGTAAVASREWYSTAAAIVKKHKLHQYCLLRLPGRLCTRGDWFLAMAKGSRSELLGHRAMDILLSRRMCLLRLQDGLGLPPRDVVPDDEAGNLLTAISRTNPLTHEISALTYNEICWLGVRCDDKQFNWLWRSQLEHYDRDCFYLRRWISRLFSERGRWTLPDSQSLEHQNARVLHLSRPDFARRLTKDEHLGEKVALFMSLCNLLDSAIRG